MMRRHGIVQNVFLLLLSSTKPLDKQQRLYIITWKICPVTYNIQKERNKPVNPLKERKEQPTQAPEVALFVKDLDVEEEVETGVEALRKTPI